MDGPAKFQLMVKLSLLISLMALTSIVVLYKDQKALVTSVSIFVFALQQFSLTVCDKRESDFRALSTLYFTSFVCLIGTFLPYRFWIIPVSLFYSLVYWIAYSRCDMEPLQYFTVLILHVLAAYVI